MDNRARPEVEAWRNALIPLWPLTPAAGEMVCACRAGRGCKHPGKHPLARWQGLSSGELERSWISARVSLHGLEPNVGLLTGARSGVTVVDVDLHGTEPLAELERQTGVRLESPLVARTGRNGCHVFYRYSGERCGTRVLPGVGVDLRGDDGYVVLPPSSGLRRPYEWMGGGPTREVLASLLPVPAEIPCQLGSSDSAATVPRQRRILRRLSDEELDQACADWPWLRKRLHEQPHDGEGDRRSDGDARHIQACRFARDCAEAGMPRDLAERLLWHYRPAMGKGAAWIRSDAPRVTDLVYSRTRGRQMPARAAFTDRAPGEVTQAIAPLRTLACSYIDERGPILWRLCDIAERERQLSVRASRRLLAEDTHLCAAAVARGLAALRREGVVAENEGTPTTHTLTPPTPPVWVCCRSG